MRSPLACAVAFLFCFLNLNSIAQTAPAALAGSDNYNHVWVAHASFQAHKREDYMTPLLVDAMVKEARRNPGISYPDLMKQAAELSAKFKEEVSYANTGRIPDPFEREQQVADWAKDVAKFSKNPLATPLAEVLSDSFRVGSVLVTGLTSLDQQQQLEYRSLLYRSAMAKLDQSFSDALIMAQKDPKFRDALNAVLGPTLDIQAGESLETIKRKSPEIIALMNSEEMLKLLRSKTWDANTQALIEKQIRIVQEQTDSTYQLVKQALDGQMNAASAQALQAEFEKQERIQSLQIETARAGLSLITKIVGPYATDDVKRALYLGDDVIRAWETLAAYGKAMRTTDDAGALEGAAMTFNLFGVMLDVVKLCGDQKPTEAEESTAEILKQLNELKRMVSDLYTMTSKRFDRLEAIIESDQRINAESFQILIVRSQMSEQDLTSIRLTLSRINDELRELRSQATLSARSNFDTKFAALQRKCYLERITLDSRDYLTKEGFESCLQEFATYALDVSHAQPFLGSTPVSAPDDAIWSLLGDPYDEQPYLLQKAKILGSSEVRFVAQPRNAYVWANATDAYVSTLDTWPSLATDTDFKRLSQLAEAGNEMAASWKSILDLDCASVSCRPNNNELFTTLLQTYSAQLLALGKAANNVAIKYAAEKSDYINPFEYGIVSTELISPADDSEFAKSIPSRTPQCGTDKNLPDYIETPPGITRLIPPEMRLAERLDPGGHQVSLCYDLQFRNRRVMYERAVNMPSWNRFVYFGTPWFTIQAHMKSVSAFPTFSVTLPDMFFAFSPTQVPELSDAKNLGEYWSNKLPANFSFKKGNFYAVAFPEWVSEGGLTTFSSTAARAVRVGDTETFETPPSTSIFIADAGSFVSKDLEKRRADAANMIEKEFTISGELQTTLRKLSGTKRLLNMFLQVVLPISSVDEPKLQAARLASLEVYEGDLEWQALLTTRRNGENHRWYRSQWYPGDFGPPANTPEERLEDGVEDLVTMGISDTRPDRATDYENVSLLCRNYLRLVDTINSAVYSGKKLPEPMPLFSATLGLANSRLSQQPMKPRRTSLKSGVTAPSH